MTTSKFFDLNSIGNTNAANRSQEKAGINAEKFLNLHCERIDSLKNLMVDLPKEGDLVELWTTNSFTAFTFIPFLIKESGTIEELIVSTYSINIRVIDALIKLVGQGKILSVELIISDSIRTKLPKVYDHLIALVANHPIRVSYCWNHSKIMLVRIGEDFYCIKGSGNWSENSQYEQYDIKNSRKSFDFYKNSFHAINS